MPIRHAIWKVGDTPVPLAESSLANEDLLEKMILAAPQMLSDEWMFIGQQEPTGLGGRIDLLAIAPDCALILIELKRDRTPREVVAQAIDYASWVEKLQAEKIAEIYGRFAKGRDLAEDFHKRFGIELDEESLNQSHQIIIVAESLDDSTERIVAYLSERGISINVLCFQVFTLGNTQLLSRTWLLDPVRTQASAAAKPQGPVEPWNGEFYCSYGASESRSWDEAVKYGFICAGGGLWYTKTLQLLNPGDRVWVKAPGYGFVGVCRVKGQSQPAASFRIKTRKGEFPALEVLKGGHYHRKHMRNKEHCEYFVSVHWLQTVPLDQAVDEVGLFGNQNTICQPTAPKWRYTVDRLKERFPSYDK
jgi:hypothetical protein